MLADLHIMLGEHRVDQPWFENDMYLCGPEGFCRELKEELVARGGNADRIRYELFSAPPVLETSLDDAEIRFARTGVTGHWYADDDLSLLEVAERLGVTVPSDCRAGSCLTRADPDFGGRSDQQNAGRIRSVMREPTQDLAAGCGLLEQKFLAVRRLPDPVEVLKVALHAIRGLDLAVTNHPLAILERAELDKGSDAWKFSLGANTLIE